MLTAVCMTAKRDEILRLSWYFLKILPSRSCSWGHRSLRVVLRSVSSSCSHSYGNGQCWGLSIKHCWCAKKEDAGIGSKEQELLCGSRIRVERWCCEMSLACITLASWKGGYQHWKWWLCIRAGRSNHTKERETGEIQASSEQSLCDYLGINLVKGTDVTTIK